MRFKRPQQPDRGSPLAPLLDVVLLLLIFFVVTSSFANQTLELELPSAESAGPPAARKALVVEIDEQGTISIDGATFSQETLRVRLAEAAREDLGVELRADRATDHGEVVAVLDLAQAVGVEAVSIAVSQSRAEAPPTQLAPAASASPD